jgi:hypothetical protein
MIDICTVVFEQELPILKIQAQSIYNHCRNIGIRNIYVVLNDYETLAEKIDPAWWGDLASSVLVVPRTAFSSTWVENGWVSQQALKILTASISYNVYTMVLDAKTIFVRPLEISKLVNEQGQLTVGQLDIYDVFKPSKTIVDQLFDIDVTKQAGPGGVPFFFHNDTVRFMIADTTIKTRESFPTWFQRQGMLTEFILYSGFCQYKYGTLDHFYTKENKLGVYVNVCHTEVDQIDQKLKMMHNQHTLTVSIHRNAWTKMSPEQKTTFKMLLIDRGQSVAWDLE